MDTGTLRRSVRWSSSNEGDEVDPMRRWLPILLVGVLWAAPASARADMSPAECVLPLPAIVQVGVASQSLAYSQGIFCVPSGDAVSRPVIEWGDGTTSVGTIMAREPGRIAVTGAHVYTNPGTFKIRAKVTDMVSGQSYSAGSEIGADIRPSLVPATSAPCEAPASLSDPPTGNIVSVIGSDFKVQRSSSTRSYEVALIRAGMSSTSLRATISWGDGTKSGGAVTGSAGTLRVRGRHRWLHSGHYAIIVTQTDTSGYIVATATGRAVVAPGKLASSE